MNDNRLVVRIDADASGLLGATGMARRGLKDFGDAVVRSERVMRNWDGASQRTDQNITRLGNTTSRVASNFLRYSNAVDRANRSTAGVVGFSAKAEASLSGLGNQVNLTRNLLQGLGYALVSMFSVSSALNATRLIGEYQAMQNQIKAVTDSTFDLAGAQKELLAVAQRSRTDIVGTTMVFTRFLAIQDKLGASTEELLRVTETVSKAITLSGATPQAAQAALVQLGQALGSGVLRGEELNSVLEQTRALGYAIAEGMGVSVGELRKMGAEGKLTADKVYQALQTMSAQVDAQFGRTVATIGESLGLVRNAFTMSLGQIAEESGANAQFAESMRGLADNMDKVVKVGTGLVGVLSLMAFGKLSNGVTQFASSILTAESAQVRAAQATVRATQATRADVAAQRNAIATQVQAAATEANYVRAMLQTQRTKFNNVTLSEQSQAILAREFALKQQLAVAEKAHTAAIMQNNRAKIAAAQANSVWAKSARGVNAVMGLFGGPAGIAITAATGFAMFTANLDEAETRMKTSITTMERLALNAKRVWRNISNDKEGEQQIQATMYGMVRSVEDVQRQLEPKYAELARLQRIASAPNADVPTMLPADFDEQQIPRLAEEIKFLEEAMRAASTSSPYEQLLGGYDQAQNAINTLNTAIKGAYNNTELSNADRMVAIAKARVEYDTRIAELKAKAITDTKEEATLSQRQVSILEASKKAEGQINQVRAQSESKLKNMRDLITDQAQLTKLEKLEAESLADKLADINDQYREAVRYAQVQVTSAEELMGEYDALQEAVNTYREDMEKILDAEKEGIKLAELRARAEEKKNDAIRDYLKELKKEARELDKLEDRFDKLGGDTGNVDMDKIFGKAGENNKISSKGFEKQAAALVKAIDKGAVNEKTLGVSITRLENYARQLGIESSKWDTQGMVNAAQEIAKYARDKFKDGPEQAFTAMDYNEIFTRTVEDRKAQLAEDAERQKWLSAEIERVTIAMNNAGIAMDKSANREIYGMVDVNVKVDGGSGSGTYKAPVKSTTRQISDAARGVSS